MFGPVLGSHHAAERDRVVRDSLNFAWANCGGVPDQPLTAEHLARLKELFADRATPWWKHATGLSDAVARPTRPDIHQPGVGRGAIGPGLSWCGWSAEVLEIVATHVRAPKIGAGLLSGLLQGERRHRSDHPPRLQ